MRDDRGSEDVGRDDGDRGAAGVGTAAAADWSAWLGARMDAVGWAANSDLGRASGVPDSAISRWRTSGTVPSIAQLRRLTGPLQASLLEMIVAAGHLTAAEARLRDVVPPVREPRGTADAIALDPHLSEELRGLLLLQYRALLAMEEARQGGPPPGPPPT